MRSFAKCLRELFSMRARRFYCDSRSRAESVVGICHNQLLLRGTLPDSQSIGPQRMDRNTEGSRYETGVSILTTTTQSFSTAQLAELTGLSMRVLQEWHRADVAPASETRRGDKVYLSYTEDQAGTVLALVDLHDRGMSWKVIRRIAAFLPRPITKHQYLIASKKIVLGRDGDASAIETMRGLANLALVVEVEDIMSKVSGKRR